MRRRRALFQRLLERLFRLHGQANGDLGGAIENFKQLIAQQTAELALYAVTARQFDAAITGTAIRTDDVGFLHDANMGPVRFDLHSAMRSQSNDRSEIALRRE